MLHNPCALTPPATGPSPHQGHGSLSGPWPGRRNVHRPVRCSCGKPRLLQGLWYGISRQRPETWLPPGGTLERAERIVSFPASAFSRDERHSNRLATASDTISDPHAIRRPERRQPAAPNRHRMSPLDCGGPLPSAVCKLLDVQCTKTTLVRQTQPTSGCQASSLDHAHDC